MEGVVAVAALAQQDFLAPLSNYAQGGLEHTVNWPQRRGGAGQVQPWKRLGNPICAHGSLDSLNEFLAIGLYPLDLTFSRRVEHSIHRSLFSGCSIAHLEDVQNPSIIGEDHSITPCSRMSIIASDRKHASLLALRKLDFSSRNDQEEERPDLSLKDRRQDP